MKTLADIVNETLSQAESSMKLASARDAKPSEGNPLAFLDDELVVPVAKIASEDDDKSKDKKDEKKEPEKKASAREVISDAEFAMKLAEALTLGSNIVAAKLASQSPLDAPGPAVQESGMQQVPTVPRAHSTVTDRISGPPTNTGPNGLPTDKTDFTSTGDESGRAKNHPGKTAGWTRSKEASVTLLRAKTAQAEVLMNLGQIEAAEALLSEVAKLSQDPSSPQPSMPAHSSSFKLDTEPGPASHIPDNAGLISIDKAQARDKTTREVSQFISEPPKKDNAVPATQLRTDGQKLSHLILPGVRKVAEDEKKDEKKDEKTPPFAKKDEKDEPEKKSSFDPVLGRAYLARLIKTASDPEAVDRTKAAEALKLIKSKLGVDPGSLLA